MDFDPNSYEALAARTMADASAPTGRFRRQSHLMGYVYVLRGAMRPIEIMSDALKREIFYGQDKGLKDKPPALPVGVSLFHTGEAVKTLDDKKVNALHAALGLVSEVGELFSALMDYVIEDKPLDRANLIEENGDILWYQAILCREFGFSLHLVQDTNIQKLASRYGDKFQDYSAINRNLDKERAILDQADIGSQRGEEFAAMGNEVARLKKELEEAKKRGDELFEALRGARENNEELGRQILKAKEDGAMAGPSERIDNSSEEALEIRTELDAAKALLVGAGYIHKEDKKLPDLVGELIRDLRDITGERDDLALRVEGPEKLPDHSEVAHSRADSPVPVRVGTTETVTHATTQEKGPVIVPGDKGERNVAPSSLHPERDGAPDGRANDPKNKPDAETDVRITAPANLKEEKGKPTSLPKVEATGKEITQEEIDDSQDDEPETTKKAAAKHKAPETKHAPAKKKK